MLRRAFQIDETVIRQHTGSCRKCALMKPSGKRRINKHHIKGAFRVAAGEREAVAPADHRVVSGFQLRADIREIPGILGIPLNQY